MALPAGRVGVAPDEVDRNGKIKSKPVAVKWDADACTKDQNYISNRDSLATFVINNEPSGTLDINYLGKPGYNFTVAGIPDDATTLFNYCFTIWVPAGVAVEIQHQNEDAHVFYTLF